jgi:hypothetical protein
MVSFGAHSCRATFCLFSILAGGDFHNAMRNARYLTLEVALGCHRDAVSTKKLLEEAWMKEGAQGQRSPPFRDILVHQDGEVLQRINRINGSSNDAVDLKGAAELFVQKMLHIDPNHPKHRDPQFLLEISYQKNFGPSSKSSEEALRESFNSLPESLQMSMHHHLNAVIFEQKCPTCPPTQDRQGPPPTAQVPQPDNQVTPHAGHASPNPPPALMGQAFPARAVHLLVLSQDANGRGKLKHGIKGSSTNVSCRTSQQQSKLLFELRIEIGGLQATPGDRMKSHIDGKKLIHKRHRYLHTRHLKAFCTCVHSCHSDDLSKFQEKNPDFNSNQFKCPQCSATTQGVN